MSIEVKRYNQTLHAAVATAVADGLSLKDLLEGLTEQIGAIIAAGSASREEILSTVEITRHRIDEKVAHYDHDSGHPYLGGCTQPRPFA